MTNAVSQEQVNQALASLEAASQALMGKIQTPGLAATTKTGRYANAKEKHVYYDRAFQTVACLAVDPTVKQAINQHLLELSREGNGGSN